MAWEQLSINKPHLVYIILGGFTSIFMLCSLFIKEKLYIGEATVATICGVIFGPHAADLINPITWGNTDQVTLEFSRIVLVVQCFAVGVELPKAYMERHWKSVVFLLVPVMTFGWLITSLFIWWMIDPLTWLESLVVAACVTATDPVLASSVVGKGKFAKRVPKHLRDVLSAESGCNDGMAFPFIYLSLYLVRYHLKGGPVVFHWVCFTILYECIFGAFYGVMIGYIGRHMIKLAERKGLIDRESFLVFYFVLALFCAGSGSLLGMDDLLIGFAAGVGFSNDGWFTEKTEESHVSNVIDLLLNLAYFVYFGTVIPWDQYNSHVHGLIPWRLVVIAILVIFFRRIPAMLALKTVIPDVRTWREALFAGHFGPIGVGAIFAAILARAELETDSTIPLAELPNTKAESDEYLLIYLIWPIVTFLVMSSILVHGSSIAVFTLGKRINTLTITLSYTQDNEKGAAWMNRLPRITSQSRSMARTDSSDLEVDEKLDIPPGELPPIGIPKLHLRRQKEDEYEKKPVSRSSSIGRSRRKKRREKDADKRLGGPISQSAIAPARRSEPSLVQQESGSDTLFEKSEEPSPQSPEHRLVTGSPTSSPERDQLEAEHEAEAKKEASGREHPPVRKDRPVDIEAYEEGDDVVVEDKEGNVVDTIDTREMSTNEKVEAIEKARNRLTKDESGNFAKHKHESHPRTEGEEMEQNVEKAVLPKSMRHRFDQWKAFGRRKEGGVEASAPKEAEKKRGPAHAYQFGNTVIVEDEDGEVIKTYTIPSEGGDGDTKSREQQMRAGLRRMSTWVGLGRQGGAAGSVLNEPPVPEHEGEEVEEKEEHRPESKRQWSDGSDDGLRLTISRRDQYGLTGLQKKNRDAPGTIALGSGRRLSTKDFIKQMRQLDPKSKIREVDQSDASEEFKREVRRAAKEEGGFPMTPGDRPRRGRTETNTAASTSEHPERNLAPNEADDYFSLQGRPKLGSTNAAQATLKEESEEEEGIPTHNVRSSVARHGQGQTAADYRRRQLATIRSDEETPNGDEGETAAEQRRRLAALGLGGEDSSSDSEDDEPRHAEAAVQEPDHDPKESSSSAQPKARIQWGGERGRVRQTEEPAAPVAPVEPIDIYAGDPVVGAARRFRKMMNKKKKG